MSGRQRGEPRSLGASFLSQVTEAFDRAARFTSHEPTVLANIKACKNLIYISFPLRREDGRIEVMHAWRAQHSHHKQPRKGGVRYAESVDGDEVQALAYSQAHAFAATLLGLSFALLLAVTLLQRRTR